MEQSFIWHFSNEEAFPLKAWEYLKTELFFQEKPLPEYSSTTFSEEAIHLVLMTVSSEEWQNHKDAILHLMESQQSISRLIIIPKEESVVAENSHRIFTLTYPVHKRELQLLVEQSIQVEIGRSQSVKLSNEFRENMASMEGIFELAREEAKSSQDTIRALNSLLTYEQKMKDFNIHLHEAIDNASELKSQEIMELQKRIEATENLEILREKELKDEIETRKATEQALEFSKEEEIQMDKIIKAQERVFKYSDEEIRALYYENLELKKKLGIPVEE
ncbi:MAG: hypothetical protein AAF518_24270 [Spirochaetota bacterium]